MACCRYRVLHQRPDRCQQRAGVLWHDGYAGHPRLPHARACRWARAVPLPPVPRPGAGTRPAAAAATGFC